MPICPSEITKPQNNSASSLVKSQIYSSKSEPVSLVDILSKLHARSLRLPVGNREEEGKVACPSRARLTVDDLCSTRSESDGTEGALAQWRRGRWIERGPGEVVRVEDVEWVVGVYSLNGDFWVSGRGLSGSWLER
jgi:hypothetical protein